MNNEKDRFGSHESFDDNALAEHGKELQEKLSEKRERAAGRASPGDSTVTETGTGSDIHNRRRVSHGEGLF